MTENVQRHASKLTRQERWSALGSEGVVVWLTGLSGSGKSSVAMEVEQCLVRSGRPAVVLDGDNLRHGLNADLGFSAADRAENIRRVGEVSVLFAEAGTVVLVPLVSPYRDARDGVRALCERHGLDFFEIHVDTPLAECERRDSKGLYAAARAGRLQGLTGIDDPYEAPLEPDLVLRPQDGDPARQAELVLTLLDA